MIEAVNHAPFAPALRQPRAAIAPVPEHDRRDQPAVPDDAA